MHPLFERQSRRVKDAKVLSVTGEGGVGKVPIERLPKSTKGALKKPEQNTCILLQSYDKTVNSEVGIDVEAMIALPRSDAECR
jgi:hypothetical protein